MAFFNKSFSSAIVQKERSETGGKYLNPSRLDPAGGSMRIHILSDEPLTGYEMWFEKREGGMAVRRSAEEPDDTLIANHEADIAGRLCVREGRRQISKFAAFFCWDYESEQIAITSISQVRILRDIDRLTSDPDYSSLSDWDLQITRNGEKLNTVYGVDFKPTKRRGALDAKITAAWNEALDNGADLGALLVNGNPFGTTEG